MENTSSGNDRANSLLMLSRAVYVKKSDNTFYPGTIDTKLPDGSYLVKFTDSSSDRVAENHIVWLGFWGLPPKCWPRNPIVQTAGPIDMALDFLDRHKNSDNSSHSVSRKTHLPDRNVRGVIGFQEMDFGSGSIPRCSENDALSQDDDGINEFETSPAHVQPRQVSENPARMSVLRMCCDGTLKQERIKPVKQPIISTEQVTVLPHFTSVKGEENRDFTFDEYCNTIQIKNDSSFGKRKLSSSEYDKCSVKEGCIRPENRPRNSFQKHYPSSPLLSPHIQNYDRPFGIPMYDSSSPPRPASIRLQPRARRRSENKKCRKVYGIENRDIWCTQCKWKKACTRFTGSEKVEIPGLMYIADYEGLHYPL
ncbi:uncharacterized protein LOC114528428 [Dendronephthya gigantea]|uniref:uncharacterized protein LOC114528428 n=1 Tax=Dendronephthya gigantea TaxID=151771 RepID=UPI00106D8991|nr:uncharacterized protein LOC114528428 [Dendronephthya gigantea]